MHRLLVAQKSTPTHSLNIILKPVKSSPEKVLLLVLITSNLASVDTTAGDYCQDLAIDNGDLSYSGEWTSIAPFK